MVALGMVNDILKKDDDMWKRLDGTYQINPDN